MRCDEVHISKNEEGKGLGRAFRVLLKTMPIAVKTGLKRITGLVFLTCMAIFVNLAYGIELLTILIFSPLKPMKL